jgi:cysteine desulfurase
LKSSIYFDYNATTPLDKEVLAAMRPFFEEVWGNPSSVHQQGRRARVFLDDARDRVAQVFGCKPSEIVFTSGGTESANLAVLGTARLLRSNGRHLITSAIEHPAVLHCFDYLERHEGFEVTRLPVDQSGLVSPETLKKALRNDTVLVSIMAANNEIGTLQPVAELGQLCRQRGVRFHTDAVQWFGKQPFHSIKDFNADLVSVCAHKIHGPKGAGALFIRSPLRLHPVLFGGSHEDERRAGTENLPAIMGLVECLERFIKTPVFTPSLMTALTARLRSVIGNLEGATVVGHPQHRLPNTLAFVVEGSDSIALLAGLDLEGICASSGSACAAGSLVPSHVIRALGFGSHLANALVRFSLGRENTLQEVTDAAQILPEVVLRAKTVTQPAKILSNNP